MVLQPPAPQPEDKQLILRVAAETLPGERNCILGQTTSTTFESNHIRGREAVLSSSQDATYGEREGTGNIAKHTAFMSAYLTVFFRSFCKPWRGKAQVIKSISSLHIVLHPKPNQRKAATLRAVKNNKIIPLPPGIKKEEEIKNILIGK